MSKKSLDKKAAQQFIVESRDNGKTDQEIYHALSDIYFDKKAVALLVTGTVTKANKEKYKTYNKVLLALLVIIIALKVLMVGSLVLSSGNYAGLLLIFIVPLFNIYFFFEIAKYSAPIYRFCGIFTLIGFFQGLGKAQNMNDVLIISLFSTAVATLSFYLDSKLFPHYAPNKLKKDDDGEYIIVQS